MSPTARRHRGFTLAEVLVSTALAGMLLLAMLSTYLYLGRNLTKLANLQVLEEKSRIALGFINRDLQMASSVSAPTSSGVVLTFPSGGTVTYIYNVIDPADPDPSLYPRLKRVATFGAFQTTLLLRADCTAFEFHYYSTTGSTELVADASNPANTTLVPLSVKRIGVDFTLERGSAALGTRAALKTVSARVLLRNKPLPNGT